MPTVETQWARAMEVSKSTGRVSGSRNNPENDTKQKNSETVKLAEMMAAQSLYL